MIYLDNAATTAPLKEALKRATKFYEENYFNPSALYGGGICVRREIERARKYFSEQFEGFDVVFTSGGTEADNQAVFSFARRGNAVTTLGEHPAVEQCFLSLKERGIEPRFAPILKDGRVDEEKLLSLVDEKTSLVSVVHVNSETGAVNNINEIAQKVKQKNPRCKFMSDGVQAFGKLPFVPCKEVDLYTLSAHKIGGLKGTGALIFRKGMNLPCYLFGGGQEGGRRSGTENVLGILCFFEAAKIRFSALKENYERAERVKNILKRALDGTFMRLSGEESSPYILSISLPSARGEVLQRMAEERGVIVGTGSACSSKKPHSRILKACGYDESVLDGVLRISFCPETSEQDITFAANALLSCAKEWKEKME